MPFVGLPYNEKSGKWLLSMYVCHTCIYNTAIWPIFQGDRDESNKVDESTAETDAEDLYEVGIQL